MEITGDDIVLFESLMEVFIQVNSEYSSGIKKAVLDRDSEQLRIHAHQAKSELASIGAGKATELALEIMGKNSSFDNIAETQKSTCDRRSTVRKK